VFYEAPKGNFKQTLGHGIARYDFFGFLNSDRATSDMGPYVQSYLPPQMQALSVRYLAKKQKSLAKRGLKKHLFTRLLQLFPSALGTLEEASLVVADPFISVTDVISGHFPGKNELAQDSSWGTATVKTDSLQGDLLVSRSVRVDFGLESHYFILPLLFLSIFTVTKLSVVYDSATRIFITAPQN
jgi:hypothetical protein